MRRLLEGQGALVTGGASGIGWGIAKSLAMAGCRVAITGRDAKRLTGATAQYEGSPPILARSCDVSDREDVGRLFDWFAEQIGRLDILVNNAGINVTQRSLAEVDPEDWDRIMKINCTGTFNCIKAALPTMRQQQAGLIVNICSISGKRAWPVSGVAYAASKFAQGALGLVAAQEEHHHGIRVTNIYPGEVLTEMIEKRPNLPSEEHRAQMLRPEDLGDCVVHVASMPPRVLIPELVITPLYQEYR